jgi:hypothetical protein
MGLEHPQWSQSGSRMSSQEEPHRPARAVLTRSETHSERGHVGRNCPAWQSTHQKASHWSQENQGRWGSASERERHPVQGSKNSSLVEWRSSVRGGWCESLSPEHFMHCSPRPGPTGPRSHDRLGGPSASVLSRRAGPRPRMAGSTGGSGGRTGGRGGGKGGSGRGTGRAATGGGSSGRLR